MTSPNSEYQTKCVLICHTYKIQSRFKKYPKIVFRLPQEPGRLLTAGSTETREPTCRNTARSDHGLGASVAFGL
jgi:hypothetical protein